MQKATEFGALLKERKFSFKNFCAIKGIEGGDGRESMKCRENFLEGERELAKGTRKDVGLLSLGESCNPSCEIANDCVQHVGVFRAGKLER